MKRRALVVESVPRKKVRTNTSQLAVTQAIVKRELRKKTDWKYTDMSFATTNVTSTGTVTSLLANLVRGDAGINTFDGNMITPQAITLKYFTVINQVYNSVRLIVFQWFDSSTPAPSGILESTATTLGTLSPILVTNKSFIKVLHDQTHILAPTAYDAGTVAGYGLQDCITVYIPGKRLKPIRYNSTTNVVQDGNLYVLAISDDSLTAYPTMSLYSRVTFQDGAS